MNSEYFEYFGFEVFDVDEAFMNLIIESSIPSCLSLVRNYKFKYSKAFKSKILDYLDLTLTTELNIGNSCGDLSVIVDPFSDCLHNLYVPIHECFLEFSHRKESINILISLIYLINSRLKGKYMNHDQIKYLYAIRTICGYDLIGAELQNEKYWAVDNFFLENSLSLFIPDNIFDEFQDSDWNSESDLGSNLGSNWFEKEKNEILNICFFILKSLIKNKKCKENFIKFTEKIYKKSLKRRKIIYFKNETTTTGFCMNFSQILMKFCLPIIEKNMIEKIDINYFNRMISGEDNTNISADNNNNNVNNNMLNNMLNGQLNNQFNINGSSDPENNRINDSAFLDELMNMFSNTGTGRNILNPTISRAQNTPASNNNSNTSPQSNLPNNILPSNLSNNNLSSNTVSNNQSGNNTNSNQPIINRPANDLSNTPNTPDLSNTSEPSNTPNRAVTLTEEEFFKKENHEFITTIFTHSIAFVDFGYIKFFDIVENYLHILQEENDKEKQIKILHLSSTIFRSNTFQESLGILNFLLKIILKQEIGNQDEKVLEIIAKLLTIEDMFFKKNFDQNKIETICEKVLLSKVNIHIKNTYLKLMAEKIDKLTPELFISLIEIYSTVHKSYPHGEINLKIILNKIIKNDVNKNLRGLEKNGSKYICTLIRDTETFLRQGLNGIIKVKELNDEIQNILNDSNNDKNNNISREQNIRNNEKKIGKIKKKITRETKYVASYFEASYLFFDAFYYAVKENLEIFKIRETNQLMNNTLNYNMKLLVGPKCSMYSIENMKIYNFHPRKLLKILTLIYSEFKTKEMIIKIIKGAEYNYKYYEKANQIMKDKNLFETTENAKNYEKFLKKLKENTESLSKEQEIMVFPDEFLDPLTFEPMLDPVILPSSKITVDRKTVDMIILGDSLDPFNRNHLEVNKIINDEVLKSKIEEFIEKNKTQK